MIKKDITETKEWISLEAHYNRIKDITLNELFEKDNDRGTKFSQYSDGVYFDYSKNLLTKDTVELLVSIAKKAEIEKEIDKMFSGEKINMTEGRRVLHTEVRNIEGSYLPENLYEIKKSITGSFEKMKIIAEKILSGNWRGATGKRIKNIVNVGIGGSLLGPLMTNTALRGFSRKILKIHFVSNIDHEYFDQVLKGLDPEETIFLIISKSLSTYETLSNFKYAKKWVESRIQTIGSMEKHFIAITADPKKAVETGFTRNNILEFGDWIGGRYSVSSPVNLSLMLSIGVEGFKEFLRGFHSIDDHFRTVPLGNNIPVLMALVGIWYNNFHRLRSYAVIPYGEELKLLTLYLQQLEMESNGKSVNREGKRIWYNTAPVIWGERGTNAQHSFFQLLHQGTGIIPVDFIGYGKRPGEARDDYKWLMSNLFAQSKALAFGIAPESLKKEGTDESLIPYKICMGNRPSNTILLDELSPKTLGQLIAIYEHKTFTQGVIWNINSFDQWGVELGKKLSIEIYSDIISENPDESRHDSSTMALINRFIKKSD